MNETVSPKVLITMRRSDVTDSALIVRCIMNPLVVGLDRGVVEPVRKAGEISTCPWLRNTGVDEGQWDCIDSVSCATLSPGTGALHREWSIDRRFAELRASLLDALEDVWSGLRN